MGKNPLLKVSKKRMNREQHKHFGVTFVQTIHRIKPLMSTI